MSIKRAEGVIGMAISPNSGSIGPAHLKTAKDKLLVQKPQVTDLKTQNSGSPETFSSQLWSHIKGRTEQLERIAVEMSARGCSTRDIEELLRDKDGHILIIQECG
jgi:hypothetical protein